MTDAPAPEMSGRDVLRRVVDILTKVIDEGYDTEPNAVAIALRRLEEEFRPAAPAVAPVKKPDPVLEFADRLQTSVGFLRGAFGSEDRADGALLDVIDLISELVRDYKKGRL